MAIIRPVQFSDPTVGRLEIVVGCGWLLYINFLRITSILGVVGGNHSIFRHDNFIGCFSADKIKKSVRKYFCFNIPVYKNMAEEPSCRSY
ncbi:hypothetical protein, partial [Bacteroides ilei]|uniref:hypothetical protein n=1 Tax=Bacteroides ilei TaxID=1907658 RepID=UPI003AB45DE8